MSTLSGDYSHRTNSSPPSSPVSGNLANGSRFHDQPHIESLSPPRNLLSFHGRQKMPKLQVKNKERPEQTEAGSPQHTSNMHESGTLGVSASSNADSSSPVPQLHSPTPLKQAEVGETIKHAGLKKAAGWGLVLLGGLPKTILNLPLVKVASIAVSVFIGAPLGLLAGSVVGLVKGDADYVRRGAILGYDLLDPRALFNGITRAGDNLLRSAGTSVNTRELIFKVTNVEISAEDFVKNEFEHLFAEAFKKHEFIENGKSYEKLGEELLYELMRERPTSKFSSYLKDNFTRESPEMRKIFDLIRKYNESKNENINHYRRFISNFLNNAVFSDKL